MPHVGVSERSELAHGLLSQRSRELCTVDRNLRGTIGQNLMGTSRDLGERETERARDMTGCVRVVGKDIHEDGRRIVQAPSHFFPRNLRNIGRACRGNRLEWHKGYVLEGILSG